MPREAQLNLAPGDHPLLKDSRALASAAAQVLGLAPEQVALARPTRVSFDGRSRERRWRASVEVFERGEPLPPAAPLAPPRLAELAADAPRVVVVGSGPAGLFAALELVRAGLRPLLLERGRDVQTRRRQIARLYRGDEPDADGNYCFGEGGAGTYSDGKLYTRSGAREEIHGVLETMVAHGAPPEILWNWRPHVGSNRLPMVVAALRATLLAAGAEVHFGLRAEQFECGALPAGRRQILAVLARELDSGRERRFACQAVILAAGHSALDSLRMAQRAGAGLAPKGFAMGVRIEHPQAWLDQRQYGGLRQECDLPAAFYELTSEQDKRGVYSFCMCPGGFIVPAASAPGHVVVNGMSLSRRDSPFANSGLVVAIEPGDWCGGPGLRYGWPELMRRAGVEGFGLLEDGGKGRLPNTPQEDPLFGVRLQQTLEVLSARAGGGRNRAPAQRADHYLAGKGLTGELPPSSYRPGLTPVDLSTILPRGIALRLRSALKDFERRLPGYTGGHAQLIAVESRTSSPVRILRDPQTLEAPELAGLYPAGEGAGYAGGIVSAALDGQRAARACAAACQRTPLAERGPR